MVTVYLSSSGRRPGGRKRPPVAPGGRDVAHKPSAGRAGLRVRADERLDVGRAGLLWSRRSFFRQNDPQFGLKKKLRNVLFT
jgi:hypothetical protein